MVDIKRQAANFTVDGLYVVSDIFARIDTVILFEGAVKGVIIRKPHLAGMEEIGSFSSAAVWLPAAAAG